MLSMSGFCLPLCMSPAPETTFRFILQTANVPTATITMLPASMSQVSLPECSGAVAGSIALGWDWLGAAGAGAATRGVGVALPAEDACSFAIPTPEISKAGTSTGWGEAAACSSCRPLTTPGDLKVPGRNALNDMEGGCTTAKFLMGYASLR